MLSFHARSAAIAACVALCSHAVAGPIDPPAGPVGPTMKTLDEVEPRIPLNTTTAPSFGFGVYAITQPGSYYLTGNIAVPAERIIGVRILAENVTLDLNGFTISGHGNATAGVSVSVSGGGVTVRNGVIDGFAGINAVGVDTIASVAGRIEDVVVRDAAFGFAVGADSIVERCVAEGSGQIGFQLDERTIVRSSIARGGVATGFSMAGGSAFGCTTSGTGRGFVSIGDVTLIDCAVNSTTVGNGIQAEFGSVLIRNCRVSDTGTWGIVVGNSSTAIIEDTVVTDIAGAGINYASSTQGRIEGCIIRNTTGAGILATGSQVQVIDTTIDNVGDDGINIVSGEVRGCVISRTTLEGIEADEEARIEGNRIDLPGRNGILVGSRCTVVGNTVTNPPDITPGFGYGINPTGSGNLIDSNHIVCAVPQSFSGIVLGPGDDNTIVRNVMVNTGIAFSGTPSGSLLGPDDDLTSPWSNFTR